MNDNQQTQDGVSCPEDTWIGRKQAYWYATI